MKSFFGNSERLEALRKTLQEWQGTPYVHFAGVKGAGCDCIHFVAKVLEELGAGETRIPWYPKDWHLHSGEELLLNGFKGDPRFFEIDVNSIEDGDIVLFKFGKTCSHCGFYLDDHVYQAITDIGVERRHWRDQHWYKRRRHAFRVVKK